MRDCSGFGSRGRLPALVVAHQRGTADVGVRHPMSLEACARCRRAAPEWNGPEHISWELVLGDDGEPAAIICPDCPTGDEQRLRAEDAAVLIARLRRGLPL